MDLNLLKVSGAYEDEKLHENKTLIRIAITSFLIKFRIWNFQHTLKNSYMLNVVKISLDAYTYFLISFKI